MRSIAGRLLLAIALSLLLHGLLIWQWHDSDTKHAKEPPPLQARLVPLPPSPAIRKSPTPKPALQPQFTPGKATAPIPPDMTLPLPAPAPLEDLSTRRFSAEVTTPPAFPKQMQLRYAVHYGIGNFKVGEVFQEFSSRDGQYTLRAETRTSGLANVLKPYHVIQHSEGSITSASLQPARYTESRIEGNRKQTYTADFDWRNGKIRLNDGQLRDLPDQTQDLLSMPFQLSRLPLTLETLPVASSNGRTLSRYFVAVGNETMISTPMGELLAIPLRKVQSTGEDGLIVWLGVAYRLLPVKITYLSRDGDIVANMLITDIRVAEE